MQDQTIYRVKETMLKEYVDDMRNRGLSENSIECNLGVLKKFIAECPQQLIEIKRTEVRDWVFKRYGHMKATTLSHRLGVLSGFFNFCVNEEYMPRNLISRRWYPRIPDPIPKYLDDSDVAKLRLTAQRLPLRDRTIIEILLNTGLRRSELCAIDIEDVNLEDRSIKVLGKGNREGIVPITEECRFLLEQLIEQIPSSQKALFLNRYGHRFSPRGIWDVVNAIGKKANLSRNLSPHMLRHTAGTKLLRNSEDINLVRNLLRHKSVKTTQRYANILGSDVIRMYQRCMG